MNKLFVFVLVSIFAGSTFAEVESKYVAGPVIQGPYKTTVIENGSVSFLDTGDREFPVSMVLDVLGPVGGTKRTLVDKYDVAGSPPKIETVFFYPINGRKSVVVLVSWTISSRGIGTYGTLYHVCAYEQGPQDTLVSNEKVQFDDNLHGIDGFQEGEEQKFKYKNAAAIKGYIKKNFNGR
jgi:hypothetical protein